MPKVTYIADDGTASSVDIPAGENIMHGAVFNGIEGIVGECGGALACATCHCYIDEAWTTKVGGPASQEERDMLEIAAADVKANSRLGCQVVVSENLDGLVVTMPDRQY